MGGAVFYLMEPVDGFNPANGLPALHANNPEIRHEMGIQAADAIARLGAVDYLAVGLADFGQPEGFLERQVPRWMSELESYSKNEGYPGPEIPGLDAVAGWLDENRPSSWKPGIMHGDYHFSNVMFAHDSGRLVAIVDWEMCTIGDPLLDLGWLMATWPQPGRPGSVGSPLASAGGLCSPEEAIAHYATRTTRDLTAIGWYKVLACFKLGIVLEGTHARAFAGKAPKPVGDMLHATTVGLFQQAMTLISEA
jgi:aminoglycoside phosphotransferase (APT) family kinase protein